MREGTTKTITLADNQEEAVRKGLGTRTAATADLPRTMTQKIIKITKVPMNAVNVLILSRLVYSHQKKTIAIFSSVFQYREQAAARVGSGFARTVRVFALLSFGQHLYHRQRAVSGRCYNRQFSSIIFPSETSKELLCLGARKRPAMHY